MRIANLSGRLVLVVDDRAVDVERASDGRFAADPQAVYDRWEEFRAWAAGARLPEGSPFDPADLGAPAPAPRQIVAAGLSYRDHASESGFALPDTMPPVFTRVRHQHHRTDHRGGPAARRSHRLGDRTRAPSSAPAPTTSWPTVPGTTWPG
ncbi:hypothetical protein [Streptomyces sp. KL116D]|uniref:hypothetical protein n=1 Tax=Streptomyces sp. KL116D TaxID=3045152 RepID=UPI003555F06B